MAMSMGIKMRGMDKVLARLKNLTPKALDRLEKVFEVATLKVQSDAQAIVRVKTGRLKLSITSKVVRKGDRIEAIVKSGGHTDRGEVPYAKRIEFGFIGTDSKGRVYQQQPYPYMQPAYDRNVENIKKNVVKAVNDSI